MTTPKLPDRNRRFGDPPSFEERKAVNALIERKKNEDLPAGSPMYYYCRACGAEMVFPEDHPMRAPTHCSACKKEGR